MKQLIEWINEYWPNIAFAAMLFLVSYGLVEILFWLVKQVFMLE